MSEPRQMRGYRSRGGRSRCTSAIASLAVIGLTTVLAGSASAGTVTVPPLSIKLPHLGQATGGSGVSQSHKAHRRAHKAQSLSLFRRGMWIWYVSRANGGNLQSIVATARKYGIKTLYIKSGDGSDVWSQFNPTLVASLHADGLRVCAWQYVYGSYPAAEARVGAIAARDGADCLMIDAEGEYEGKYVQAQTYIRKLRSLIGGGFPVGLAGLPYVDYHPAFPYSVFLGPGGAQYDAPQMYWSDIGTSVDEVYTHTYTYNRPYGRLILPLGDSTTDPPAGQIYRFRQLSKAYGAPGVSWWEWSQTPPAAWRALAHPVRWLSNYTPSGAWPVLSRGASGDLVVWAQEHLYGAGQKVTIDGNFGPRTQGAVKRFQSAHGLSADGVIGPMTWRSLVRYAPASVTWTSGGAHVSSTSGNALVLGPPKSARLRAKRYEIPWDLGAH